LFLSFRKDMHRVLPALAVCFDANKLFYLLVVISLSLLHTTIFEHREFMAAMDVLVSPGGTTAGVSFLGSEQPQNPPVHREARHSEEGTEYDWQLSTEENYRSDPRSGDGFVGEFREFRDRLDPTYHNGYVPERQALQDTIIRSILSVNNRGEAGSFDFPIPAGFDISCQEGSAARSPVDNKKCENETVGTLHQESKGDEDQRQGPITSSITTTNNKKKKKKNDQDKRIPTPWIVFTAGVYGAGKSHTIQRLQDLGCFPPRSSFVGVDPDEIRRRFPEFSVYESDRAGALTQKEAGMVAELLTDIALSSGKNVVVDGSLRDAAWHEAYFRSLRSRFGSNEDHGTLRIGILYVTAPTDEIYQRVEQRGASTGRAVPPEFLERSMREVPEAIERLRPLSDFFLHVHNAQETSGETEEEQTTDGHAREEAKDAGPSFPITEGTGGGRGSASMPERSVHDLVHPQSEAEGTIFQEKCLSIVGYG